jgi:hypothetical protein
MPAHLCKVKDELLCHCLQVKVFEKLSSPFC